MGQRWARPTLRLAPDSPQPQPFSKPQTDERLSPMLNTTVGMPMDDVRGMALSFNAWDAQ